MATTDNVIIPATGTGGTANPSVECATIAGDGSARQVVQIGGFGPNSAGVAIDTGNGVTSTGTQRVTISSDSTGSITITGAVTVSGTVAVTQSGTWNINNISGTVSLPTGASTSALQTSVGATAHMDALAINTTLGTPMQMTGGTVGLVAGTAVIGHVINDASSAVIGHVITDTGSTTAVTGTVTVSGTVTATVAAVGATGSAVPASAIYDGINVAGTMRGHTGVNPTGTVYAAQGDITSVNGVTVLTGTGNTGTGCQRVTVAVDSATVAGSASLPAGTNVIGHIITDTGSTTAVTGTVTVSGTVAATQSGTWNIGTVTTVTTVTAVTAITNALPAGTNLMGKVGIDQTTPGTTNAVALAQINAATTLAGNGVTGTGAQRITIANDNTGIANWGQGATGSAVPSGAQYKGLIATTANPSAATAGNLVGAMADKVGRQVVVPYQVRDLVGNQKATLSNTTSETTIVTAVASTFLDILSFNFSNTGSTATKVDVRDDTGGTIRASFMVPAGDMRGQTYTVPFPQTAVNKNWTAQCTAATTAMEITVQYVKNI